MIFYEKRHAEELLENGFTSFMNFKDLSTLAKYFKYLGKNKNQIRKDLVDFCKKYNPDFNEILSWNKIGWAINYADRYSLRVPVDIIVTRSELENIKSIHDYDEQKIIFVMLVIAKHLKYTDNKIKRKKKTENNNGFYTDTDIPTLKNIAKVRIKKKDFTNLLYDVDSRGLIDTTYFSSFKINFVDENSPEAIKVTNMNEIISFYPFFCERCGEEVIKKSKRHNFCDKCYEDFRRETWAKSKRKIRKDDKN